MKKINLKCVQEVSEGHLDLDTTAERTCPPLHLFFISFSYLLCVRFIVLSVSSTECQQQQQVCVCVWCPERSNSLLYFLFLFSFLQHFILRERGKEGRTDLHDDPKEYGRARAARQVRTLLSLTSILLQLFFFENALNELVKWFGTRIYSLLVPPLLSLFVSEKVSGATDRRKAAWQLEREFNGIFPEHSLMIR